MPGQTPERPGKLQAGECLQVRLSGEQGLSGVRQENGAMTETVRWQGLRGQARECEFDAGLPGCGCVA